MKCRHSLRAILSDRETEDPSLRQHLEQCQECRHTQAIVRGLREHGAAARGQVLSPSTCKAARKSAAALLRQRPEATPRPLPALRPLARRAWLAAAAVVVLLGIVLARYGVQPRPAPATLVEHSDLPEPALPAGPDAHLEEEIAQLQTRIESRLDRFHDLHRGSENPRAFRNRAGRVRRRILISTVAVNEELKIAPPGKEAVPDAPAGQPEANGNCPEHIRPANQENSHAIPA